ncbi:MAG: alpha-ketoglutarate-dependent dioxygenase AlkB [Anaerolineae bacterium]|nr:alpha-ketoglutarate-dependent dioxygenase AlkB [Anaerolineae bacterium]
MPDADVTFYPQCFALDEADALLQALIARIAWKQDHIQLFGSSVTIPRLTAWYGDPGRVYTYSGITQQPLPWTDDLLLIKARVEQIAGASFNSVLLNYYRDGRDSVSWHSDDEPELGTNPLIASVSFGAARQFQFKHKHDPQQRASIELTHGSLLLMGGATQHFWKHQIPKSKRVTDARINLTFRTINATQPED